MTLSKWYEESIALDSFEINEFHCLNLYTRLSVPCVNDPEEFSIL